jgi:hypothetical protein
MQAVSGLGECAAMSAAVEIVRRNDDGVLLRYRTDVRGPHHDAQRHWPSDRLRMAILRAERQVRMLEIIAEHLELSAVGADRIAFALRTIEAALTMARDEIAARVAG